MYKNFCKIPWLEVKEGKFYPTLPESIQYSTETIAGALSRTCRFGGHLNGKQFLSVAEHSVLMLLYFPELPPKQALFHDAAEAYLGDIPSPLKSILPNYRFLETGVMEEIARQMQFNFPLDKDVKAADAKLCWHEAKAIGLSPANWNIEYPGDIAGFQPGFWLPAEAEVIFNHYAALVCNK